MKKDAAGGKGNEVAVEGERVDERVRKSKAAVIAATHELLTQQGFAGVSVDAISSLAGVAKTTIYRHWPNRTALLMDACTSMGNKPALPETGTFRDDVEVLVRFVANRLTDAQWPRVLPSIIDAAERDPEIGSVHGRMHIAMTAPFRQIVESAKARGELAQSINPTEIASVILGPCFYRRWFSREPLDESFIKFVIDSAVKLAGQ